MKKVLLTLALVAGISVAVLAEKQTVRLYVPEMECDNCKGKVENVLAYERGVKKLDFDVAHRTVTIVFEDKRTNVEKLQAALMKYIKYESKELKEGEHVECNHEHHHDHDHGHDHNKKSGNPNWTARFFYYTTNNYLTIILP